MQSLLMQFSDQLTERYRKYMKTRHGVCLSVEQADLHLASLSKLYISFSFSKNESGLDLFRPDRTSSEGRGGKSDRRKD